MTVKDLAQYRQTLPEQTRAWYVDQLVEQWAHDRKRPNAPQLGTKAYRTVCRETPGEVKYSLLNAGNPDDPRTWLPFREHVENMMQELTSNGYVYKQLAMDPDVRGWCRSLLHDGFEAEMLLRTEPGRAAPEALLVIRTPDDRNDLFAQGFVAYTGGNWVLSF